MNNNVMDFLWSKSPDLQVKLAVALTGGLSITHNDTAYTQLVMQGSQYREQYPDTPPGQVPGVNNARSFFRAIGLDPTKRRPSSEALLQRALKEKGFHQVNTLVDTGNWCSLDFLLPICVYDADKIRGSVEFRMGRENEFYLGHNHNEVHLYGRYCVADESGPFGSPITDSVRTAVDTDTKNAVLLIFAPQDYPEHDLAANLDTFIQRSHDICGGALIEKILI